MTSLRLSRDVQGGGTHALIIGASHYEHLPEYDASGSSETLGLKRLRSAALAAWRVSDWLERNKDDLALPLASLRLLLSPAREEIEADPGIENAAPRASFASVKQAAWEWRASACRDEDCTVFYFAGHGLGSDDKNAILLADDFAAPSAPQFDRAFRLSDLDDGMAASIQTPTIAQRQFYFVDACRDTQVEELDRFPDINCGVIFDDLNIVDLRERWTFFATSHGLKSAGIAGKGSLFSDALLQAFESAADHAQWMPTGQKAWPVTSDTLRDWVVGYFEAAKLPQKPRALADSSSNLLFRYLTSAPTVDLSVVLSPEECVASAKVDVLDSSGALAANFSVPQYPHPFHVSVPMGVYTVAAEDPTFGIYREADVVTFKRNTWSVRMR